MGKKEQPKKSNKLSIFKTSTSLASVKTDEDLLKDLGFLMSQQKEKSCSGLGSGSSVWDVS